jgi:murein L,D-transpeptidase YafK
MTPENLAAHRDDPNMPFWKNLKEGYDIFEARHREPKVAACSRRYVFNAVFEGESSLDPLADCPKRLDVADPAVVAKQASDERKIADLVEDASAPKLLAYQDGGMHPSFRALLEQNGPDKLAAKVSDIKYPVSRPDAALSDPYE